MPSPATLNFITGNGNKLAEVKAILEPAGIQVVSHAFEIDEVQGNIESITEAKCRKAAELMALQIQMQIGCEYLDYNTQRGQQAQGPVLVEDTALCFNALGGLPGPYIKWFLDGIGHDGLNNLLAAYPDKSAQAVCTFAYSAGPGQSPILFQGRTDGKIVPARGPALFGWDSIFEYNGQTYAEMDKAEKNKISHRGRALATLQAWFQEGGQEE